MFRKLIRVSGIILLLAGLNACQEEVVEIIDPPADQVIQATSAVKDLVQRTSAKDGSGDNIIDGSSCTSVVYPVTVLVDGNEVVVESEDDLDDLENLLEASDDDDAEISFPITLILPDYSEVVVNDEDELDDLTDDCEEGGLDDDIECLDFIYPLTISLYDANNQLASVITVENDEQLYRLFDDLEDDEFLSFSFPLTVVLWDGREVVVTSNSQLEDLINEVEDDCDEDDDDDFDDDDIDDSEFTSVLTSGDWRIELLVDEGDDLTTRMDGYTLSFNSNSELVISGRDPELTGQWNSSGSSGSLKLEIDLDDDDVPDELEDALDAISETWIVDSFTGRRIELIEGSDDDDDSVLILTKE